MAENVGVCAGCGAPVSAAASLMTEMGNLCGACFERYRAAVRARDDKIAAAEVGFGQRATMAALVHAIIWAVTFIVVAPGAGVSTWIPNLLLVGTLGLAIGLHVRSRIAYLAALALDGVGSVILVVGSVVSHGAGHAWFGFFAAPFILIAGGLLLLARKGFAPKPPGSL
jgi:hypothetical protein